MHLLRSIINPSKTINQSINQLTVDLVFSRLWTKFCVDLRFLDKNGDEGFYKKYIVKQVIGNGGFGTVYGGYRRCDETPVGVATHLSLICVI